jgi:ABC-type multidrug transport system fused ATPase/permease subunit
MDAHTERLVMTGVERLLQGRTGFVIAHRLSTVMKADLVAVLDGGRVVETGRPAQLLNNPSTRFAALAQAQLMTAVPGGEPAPRDRLRLSALVRGRGGAG